MKFTYTYKNVHVQYLVESNNFFFFIKMWNWHINFLPSSINVALSIALCPVSLVTQTILMEKTLIIIKNIKILILFPI